MARVAKFKNNAREGSRRHEIFAHLFRMREERKAKGEKLISPIAPELYAVYKKELDAGLVAHSTLRAEFQAWRNQSPTLRLEWLMRTQKDESARHSRPKGQEGIPKPRALPPAGNDNATVAADVAALKAALRNLEKHLR